MYHYYGVKAVVFSKIMKLYKTTTLIRREKIDETIFA
jgi:hypothetical protein